MGRESSQVVSAFRCVRRGRRVGLERERVIEVCRSVRSCCEGSSRSEDSEVIVDSGELSDRQEGGSRGR